MKHLIRFALALAMLLCAAGCGMAEETVDYAASVRLDLNSETVKAQVSVRTFVDGDTTHFDVPDTVSPTGVLKARYLAVDTPESTGRIEEYGKKASEFTRERLSAATDILIESDDDRWRLDATGSRYLVWVWYKTAESDEYRNLNIELLQLGLARANSSKQNRYGDVCMAAIEQARAQKLNVYSGEPDPDFYYGDAIELTLRELRAHPEQYDGKKVAFKGVITVNHNNAVYVEDYDAETGLYFGMQVYYGFNLNGAGLEILRVGNEARIVGMMQFYEAGGVWQVSGLSYRMMKPDDPGNLQKLSDGHEPSYALTSAATLVSGTVALPGGETYPCAQLAQATSVEVRGLTVRDAVADGDALILLCEGEGEALRVRLTALSAPDGTSVNPAQFTGKTIDVRGIVGFDGDDAQIETYALRHIILND